VFLIPMLLSWHCLYSEQTSVEKAQIPEVLLPVVPYMFGGIVWALKAIHDEAQSCLMSWWAFLSHHFQSWAIYCWLPWTGLACLHHFKLVSKVCTSLTLTAWWLINVLVLTRCDAQPENLDGPGSHCHSHTKTDFLINKWDPGILWDQFGVRSDIMVCSDSTPFVWLPH
jgi:hypothetical protein